MGYTFSKIRYLIIIITNNYSLSNGQCNFSLVCSIGNNRFDYTIKHLCFDDGINCTA